MSTCSPSVSNEVKDLNQQSVSPADAHLTKSSDRQLQHEDDEERNRQGDDNVDRNAEESGEDDEEEDVDFNPFLRETHSVEASSSLSSEVEGLDVDVADSGGNTSAASVKNSKAKHANAVHNYPIGDTEFGEEIVMQTVVSSGEALAKMSEITSATVTEREPLSISQSDNGFQCDMKNGSSSRTDVSNAADSRKLIMDVDPEDAICMRTRARYSLASFTLDELETFLQETDDEDDLQNVDDEKEYRKFLAAVLQGVDDSLNLKGNENVDDEDEENDADFELELEEALESDPDEIEDRSKTRLNRRQKSYFEHSKVSGQSNRPLRPLLPFASIGSFPTHDGKHLVPNISPPYMPPVNNGLVNGFTPHQIGQLHCLIHEHMQLLIQIFSICVLEPAKGHIATELQKLILEMLHKRDEVLAWRRIPYPSFCFFPPYIHPSLPDELPKIFLPQYNNEMFDTYDVQRDRLSGSNTALHSDKNSPSNGRYKNLPSEQAVCFQTRECTSWVPYISGLVLSVLDVAPLRLVGNYIDDVSSAVRAYERCQIGVGFDTRFEREPLFPLCNFPCTSEPDGQGLIVSSPASNEMPKKTMASTLIEKAKNQSVALVPKEIAKLAQRFCPLFNPALYPHKPPPAPLTSRVLFTDSEDELLALGLMEYNTDWKAIQQRFLPCKSKHQIFIRQKNRASSKAPENPIKAVRRIKNSPLTSEEIARIEVGLKKCKLDWISIWRFLVPYRDPSLLPRQWRIALGTQKSYKSDANKKAKRRLYESKRRASKPSVSTRHSSSGKEDCSTDNAIEEGSNADNCMDWEDEAYVHEAFLADWRPDNSNISSKCPTHLPSLEGSQVREEMDNSGGGDVQTQSCTKFSSASRCSGSKVVLRPYRARRANNARLVKLARDLPPVNLPPSVRIMSQSAFKCSQAGASTKICSAGSAIGGTMAENTALQVVRATKSGVDSLVKPGQIRSISMENTISNQHQNTESLRNKCLTEERGDPDLQMHPLLFQAPEDGALQYYPLNSSTSTSSSFSLFSGNQPQLNLGLFHNPRHLRDAVNFLTKSSKPREKKSSSFGMDFHPLLQRANDVDSDMLAAHSAAKLPSNAESGQRDGSLSASCSKLPSPRGKANELDLDIHLSFTSRNDKSMENRNVTENCIDRSVNAAVYGSLESENAKDSSKYKQRDPTPEGISYKLDSGDHVLVTSTNERSRKFSGDMGEESVPEIVMEHEELSDSEDEFGENVEFEREEMTDSEGGDTSDSEEFIDIPNEEVHQDITDADSDDQTLLNTNGDPGDLKNATTMYNFGPFGENQVPASSKRSVKHIKLEISRTGVEKHSKDLQHHSLESDDPALRKPSKRVCRIDSNLRSAGSEKGNSSSNIVKSVENPKNVTKDEFV
ncbi:Homeodomain-like superfamily protein [Abeliophyllum distichum]|uniref:Homeodomain-like superfamily protein n=1 Tax=Abeliophyllum distichum TaxID=126358 RepID=A0ABD1TZP5_9LAMI